MRAMIELLEQPVEKQVSCRCCVPFWNYAVVIERHGVLYALQALEALFFLCGEIYAIQWLCL